MRNRSARIWIVGLILIMGFICACSSGIDNENGEVPSGQDIESSVYESFVEDTQMSQVDTTQTSIDNTKQSTQALEEATMEEGLPELDIETKEDDSSKETTTEDESENENSTKKDSYPVTSSNQSNDHEPQSSEDVVMTQDFESEQQPEAVQTTSESYETNSSQNGDIVLPELP